MQSAPARPCTERTGSMRTCEEKTLLCGSFCRPGNSHVWPAKLAITSINGTNCGKFSGQFVVPVLSTLMIRIHSLNTLKKKIQ